MRLLIWALPELEHYRRCATAVPVPLLANLTEFWITPCFRTDELAAAGVRLALYPLSAFRAMNRAALNVYRAIRAEGTQAAVVDTMQTRAELYESLDYHAFERQLDRLFTTERGAREMLSSQDSSPECKAPK